MPRPSTPPRHARSVPDPSGQRMSLGRHARHYLLIGLLQWLVDWGVMVVLSHWMAIEPANIAGRVAGALLGYWLNGKLTFAGEETAVGRTQLLRFLAMWLVTTAISTWSMGAIDDGLGLQWARWAKPGVEFALGVVGFLLSRHWVYKQ
jgi:putative flippase GtrA